MRYEFSALPWELLGPRPVLVTVTYPADWRRWAPDARAVVAHREALKERWRKRFGAPVGVWVMEFQPRLKRPVAQRQAPHIHMYVGLPDAVSDEEYDGLLRRNWRRRSLEHQYGTYGGRARLAPLREGEFCEWLLRSWWEIVGSGESSHRRRGADVTPVFWSEEIAATANRTKIAEYFWRESGKWGQKTPPEGFGGLNFYGRWGGRRGFSPVEGCREIDKRVFVELRRVYRRLIQKQLEAEAKRRGLKVRKYKGPRRLDGLTLFVQDAPTLAGRLEDWAWGEALRKAMGRDTVSDAIAA